MATLSAMIELLPWAMLAKGPAWIRAALPSRVCMRLGLMASLSSTVMAPPAPMSSAVSGLPDFV